MAHGLTKRLQRLLDDGEVSERELRAAEHEADVLGHPYIGIEHVELARLSLAGQVPDWNAARARLAVGVHRRWWRPRGPRSALRRAGRARSALAQRAARETDDDTY